MPTITFTVSDQEIDRIASIFARKIVEALKEHSAPPEPKCETPKPEPPKIPSAEWLTTSDICRVFSVSRSTVWRWANEEGMPCRRVGGIVRFPAAKVQEWAEKHSTKRPASS
jgi:excisionase family DNA binding protein